MEIQEVVMQIHTTKNYDKFTLIKGNRPVNEKHVKTLMLAMQENPCVSPIQVNEDYTIIDGAHRFTASKRLKLPIQYYIVPGANLQTVQTLNSNTKNWLTTDYLASYATDIEEYKKYNTFQEQFGFGLSVNLLLLTGSYDRRDGEIAFKSGKLKIKDLEEATMIAMKLEQVGKYYKGYKNRSWVYALYKCIKNEQFNWNKFITACEYQQRKLVTCSSVKQYLEVISEIYNYRSRGIKLHLS